MLAHFHHGQWVRLGVLIRLRVEGALKFRLPVAAAWLPIRLLAGKLTRWVFAGHRGQGHHVVVVQDRHRRGVHGWELRDRQRLNGRGRNVLPYLVEPRLLRNGLPPPAAPPDEERHGPAQCAGDKGHGPGCQAGDDPRRKLLAVADRLDPRGVTVPPALHFASAAAAVPRDGVAVVAALVCIPDPVPTGGELVEGPALASTACLRNPWVLGSTGAASGHCRDQQQTEAEQPQLVEGTTWAAGWAHPMA
mmetsp:Transcript_75591/g.133535  ORF Transcript_75591/g.133535 Transcript_75591/m.133535 type:complete len:248 (+) Transcript_75591:93-836(+)